jgi:hypothetical protein
MNWAIGIIALALLGGGAFAWLGSRAAVGRNVDENVDKNVDKNG